jgi:hypothetical protein
MIFGKITQPNLTIGVDVHCFKRPRAIFRNPGEVQSINRRAQALGSDKNSRVEPPWRTRQTL